MYRFCSLSGLLVKNTKNRQTPSLGKRLPYPPAPGLAMQGIWLDEAVTSDTGSFLHPSWQYKLSLPSIKKNQQNKHVYFPLNQLCAKFLSIALCAVSHEQQGC